MWHVLALALSALSSFLFHVHFFIFTFRLQFSFLYLSRFARYFLLRLNLLWTRYSIICNLSFIGTRFYFIFLFFLLLFLFACSRFSKLKLNETYCQDVDYIPSSGFFFFFFLSAFGCSRCSQAQLKYVNEVRETTLVCAGVRSAFLFEILFFNIFL